jgi:HPt (histidine-containing phosphotransfer) domain-containing protein
MEQHRSRFASDPRLSRMVSEFADAMVSRTEAFAEALQKSDINQLSILSHKLKGSAGGYGFDSISEAAARLEQATLETEADLSSVSEHVEDLIQLCHKARCD